jgi:SAM-dependent methyltransferase
VTPPRIELDPTLGTDDYDWTLYHLDYRAQLEAIEKDVRLRLREGDAHIVEGRMVVSGAGLSLHPNHTCLYETIGALAPSSVIEIGCGGGDHLHNLGVLYPSIERKGFDRSPEQLKFLAERSPHLAKLVSVLDATMPPAANPPQADVVYTQAVIMHIQAGNGHLVALHNIFRMARKQVVLMENWKRHPFVDDIRGLYEDGMLAWKPRFYYRTFDGKPHLLVVSKEELPFDPLVDYRQLTEAMSWKPNTSG